VHQISLESPNFFLEDITKNILVAFLQCILQKTVTTKQSQTVCSNIKTALKVKGQGQRSLKFNNL